MDTLGIKLVGLILAVVSLTAGSSGANAQQTPEAGVPIARTVSGVPQATTPVAAPQVKTVGHRLNGMKILYLLRRNGINVAPLNDETLLADALQTNISAGLLLGDGAIVARLPRAELEIWEKAEVPMLTAGLAPNPLSSLSTLFVMENDGNERSLRFVGLDGGTGLSLLTSISATVSNDSRDAREETLQVGQRLRLMSPVSAPQTEGLSSDKVFVNMAVLEGSVTSISRSPSGRISRLTISVPNFSSTSLGGVTVNDAGETVGLIESGNGNAAEVIPIAAVRRAVDRIRAGFKSRPRPWLGVRGAPVASMPVDELVLKGWNREKASRLISKQLGLVLTAVPPRTPASVADLRVGDIVTHINGGKVTGAEDFSSFLGHQTGKVPVRFTIVRPESRTPLVLSVRLNVSTNPVLEMKLAEQRAERMTSPDPLLASGIETLPIAPELAARLNARGGLFVVFVHPHSTAANAGVVSGDIIESIGGKLLTIAPFVGPISGKLALEVIRNGQKLEFHVSTETILPDSKP